MELHTVEWLGGPFHGHTTQVTEAQLYDGFPVTVTASIDGQLCTQSQRAYPCPTPFGFYAKWPEYQD